jgi:CCR4-NOT transcription complex subunit 1
VEKVCRFNLTDDRDGETFFTYLVEDVVARAFDEPMAVHSLRMDEDTPEDEAAAAAEADIPKLNYPLFDGYSSLVFLIVKNWDVVRAAIPSATTQVKAQIVARALNAIVSVLGAHAERDGAKFNQRPFFRLFLCMLMDMNTADHVIEPINFHNLSALSNSLQQCNPSRHPSFVFAWLELISHRLFMPKMLTAKGQRGWVLYQRLISQLFLFVEPYLRNLQLTDSMRLLYKGTLRVLLVLLHDFPEFLSDNHFLFCDVLPVCCVQMRNLVLSAFPRNMKLPDPFMPNLKVDLLPDIKVSPRILSNYSATLNQHAFKADLDQFFRTREQGILRSLLGKLRLPAEEAEHAGTAFNVPLLSALLLYVGMHMPQGSHGLTPANPSLEIFIFLATELNAEGRYLFISSIANHLRYPNAYTHYFSCVLLYLFAETENGAVQEQITRVLLERLIVHRPHPWGLLITFIELIKNPRYQFWLHPFVTCAPEVEKLFQSVAHTCLGSGGAGAITAGAGPGTAVGGGAPGRPGPAR